MRRYQLFENDATAENGPTTLAADLMRSSDMLDGLVTFAARACPGEPLTLKQVGTEWFVYAGDNVDPVYVIIDNTPEKLLPVKPKARPRVGRSAVKRWPVPQINLVG